MEQQEEGELAREYARAWALASAGLARVTWSFFSALTMSRFFIRNNPRTPAPLLPTGRCCPCPHLKPGEFESLAQSDRIEKGFISGELYQWSLTGAGGEGVPPVDICQYLKTFLVAVMVVVVVGFATGISWAETRDAPKYPTLHKTTHNKGFYSSKCQQCGGRETLINPD